MVAILNKCNNNLKNFIDSSDPESLNQAKIIDKKFYNTPIFEGNSVDISTQD